MDVWELLAKAWPYFIVASPGIWAIWKQWNGGKSLVAVAQEAASAVIKSLQDRLEDVERELAEFKQKHDAMMEAKDARILLLEQQLEMRTGELRQWQATAESYDRLLTERGIDHIPPGETIWLAKDRRMLLASGPLPEANT